MTRQLAHEPFGWRPTTLLVTIRRYRAPATLLTATPTPRVVIDDPARQHRPIRVQALAGHLQAEFIEAAEHGQIRASEGSVRHVEVFQLGGVRTPIIGRPRPLPR